MLLRKVLSVLVLMAFLPTLSCGGPEDPSAERYEGLEVGQTVEFSSGLAVTLEDASLMTPPEPQTMAGPRGEVESVSFDLAAQLRQEMREGNRLVNVRFSIENTNQIGKDPSRPLEAGQWEAQGHSGPPLEGGPIGGATELSNPHPDYPYRGWQEELAPGKKRQGTIHFIVPEGTELRVRYIPVLRGAGGANALAEWDLGNVSKLSQDQV